MPRLFIYKNNANDGGNWDDFFAVPAGGEWGSGPEFENLEWGDSVIAYQTDRRAALGLLSVLGCRRPGDDNSYAYFRPVKQFDPPIEIELLRAAAPSQFRPGYIRTLYQVPQAEVQELLDLAGSSAGIDCTLRDENDENDCNDPCSDLSQTAAYFLLRNMLRRDGWEVQFVDPEANSFDFLCRRDLETLRLSVAAVDPKHKNFHIPVVILKLMESDPTARIALVAGALGPEVSTEIFSIEQLREQFEITIDRFIAEPR